MKTSFFRAKHSSDRGVALLFALGMLAALMLLGIAFTSSSLFSRRIAENRSNGNDARLLARSVANLVAGAVMMYEAEINVDTNTVRPTDYSAVLSRVTSAGSRVYDEFLRGYVPANSAKSNYSRLDVDRRQNYDGADSIAEWIYVRDSDGRIIGRYAYQVLPRETPHRINLYHVLLGNADGSNTTRLGQSIGELNLDYLLNGDALTAVNQVPAYYSDLFASETPTHSDSYSDCIQWWQSTFLEGTTPCFREIAPGGKQRFNLTRWEPSAAYPDPWLIRFDKTSDSLKNGTAAEIRSFLNTMTAPQDLPIQGDYEGKVTYDKDEKDKGNPLPGLAFLRVIGNDAGSFNSLTDLRYQIVANFNDYCDSDSIPTSDVKNAEWRPDNVPTFTGNEKTLYVNEIVYAIVNNFSVNAATVTLNSADLILGAELIDVYGNQEATTPENLSASGYKLTSGIQSGSAKIVLEPTVDFTYVIKVTDKSVTPNVTSTKGPYTLTNEKIAKDKLSDSLSTQTVTWANASFEISNFTGDLAYKIGTTDADKVLKSSSASWDFSGSGIQDALKSVAQVKDEAKFSPYKDETKYSVSVEIESIVVKKICPTIAILDLEPSNLVLSDGTNNVDYVTIQRSGSASSDVIKIKEEDSLQTADYSFDDSGKFTLGLFVGGMEAKDPRQNLNVNAGDSAHPSDWTWNPKKVYLNANLGVTQEEAGGSFVSPQTPLNIATITTSGIISGIKGWEGYRNTEAKPSDAGSDADPETVEDPGWKSNTEMISTAIIRNEPMKSPWELGFIHRGAQFQTINLKSAQRTIAYTDSFPSQIDNTSGTSYADGDGGILDWIKMTSSSHSFGKLNIRGFLTKWTEDDPSKDRNAALLTSLFSGVPTDNAVDFVRDTMDGKSYTPSSASDSTAFDSYAKPLHDKLINLSDSQKKILDRRSKILDVWDWTKQADNLTDADQERIIGRTFNLLTVNAIPPESTDAENYDQFSQLEPPPVFYAVIIAQTIKDVGGGDAVSSDHPDQIGNAAFGSFDVEADSNPKNNVHYDVITGESKILATYERDPQTGRVFIRDIETIE